MSGPLERESPFDRLRFTKEMVHRYMYIYFYIEREREKANKAKEEEEKRGGKEALVGYKEKENEG